MRLGTLSPVARRSCAHEARILSSTPPADTAASERPHEDDAFRELHGRRLHGFALLLALGDRQEAARLTADALRDGLDRIETLRHPERAAAWLRGRVLAGVRGRRSTPAGVAALEELGVGPTALAGLARLDPRARAAVVARAVEGLEIRDVGTIVGREGAGLERMLDRSMRGYVSAAAGSGADEPDADGPLARRLDDAAQRAIA